MPQDFLTVPEEISKYRPFFITGNEYLSLPEINPINAGIVSINVLSLSTKGLLEFKGTTKKPLIIPFVKISGKEIDINKKITWSYKNFWVPEFCYAIEKQFMIKGKIFTPPGHRGGVYHIEVKNTCKNSLHVEVGFKVNWDSFNSIIFNSKEIKGDFDLAFNKWTQSLTFEARSSMPLAALSLGFDKNHNWKIVKNTKHGSASASTKLVLKSKQRTSLPLYISANIEGDGAGTTVVDLRRHSAGKLYDDTISWLQDRTVETSKFKSLANKNMFLNYFYAIGRTIDTDELVPITSRSPRYYVSAAFWGRDCLLWSFPGLLMIDLKTAREVLLRVYTHHLERAGEHAHYINGVLLYPGFELDQLAAYILAIKGYYAVSKDYTIFKEDIIIKGLKVILEKLFSRQDKLTGLFSTFLDPSDDPVKYPFLIYSNALAQRGLSFLSKLQKQNPGIYEKDLNFEAVNLKKIIYDMGIVEGPLGPMFAWSIDGKGNFQLYDNPPGSLQLLAYYGFCGMDEIVFQNTVRWVHSKFNPYYHNKGLIKGAASRHAHNPWPLSAANDFLALDLDKGTFFEKASMDNGFCCETVNPMNGKASTGLSFASASGFLANAIWQTFGENK